MPIVQMPDGTQVSFPDEMPAEQIKGMIASKFPQASPDTQPATKAPIDQGAFRTGLDQSLQGATFGFGDEISDRVGALGASLITGEKYNDLLQEARNNSKQRLADEVATRPVLSIGSNLGGAVLTGVAATPASVAKIINEGGTTARIAKNALAGGVMGSLYGAGTASDGDMRTGVIDGGLTGAALGAALPPLVRTAFGVVGGVGNGVKSGVSSVAGMVQNYTNPERAALQKIGAAIINDSPEISPQEFLKNLYKNNLTPAEAGGENINAMTDALVQQPGTARPFVKNMMDQRTDNQRDEIINLINQATGSKGQGTNAIEMAAAAKARIAPLADAAFNGDNSIIGADARINALMQNPDIKSGLPRGLQILRNEADAAGHEFNPNDYAITNFNEAGDPIIGNVPNMRLIDAAKRGLDAKITENSNDFGHLNDVGRSQYLLKRALVDRAKELNPAYADYLSNAASEFSLQNAAKMGRGIWNTPNKEETITQLSKLSTPEKKVALDGAIRGLIENIQRNPVNASNAATKLSRPYYRDLLEPLVPSKEALDGLVDNLQQRAEAFSRNSRWLNQSATAMRQEYIKDSGAIPIKSWHGYIADTIHNIVDHSGAVRDQQMRLLLDQNPNTAVLNMQRAIEMAPQTPPVNFITAPQTPTPAFDYNKYLRFLYSPVTSKRDN